MNSLHTLTKGLVKKQALSLAVMTSLALTGMTYAQDNSIETRLKNKSDSIETNSIRQPAEFEPMRAVMIKWSPAFNEGMGITYEIIKDMAEVVKVVTLVDNAADQEKARNTFLQHNIKIENVEFLITPEPIDIFETRDYGPWFAFNKSGQLGVVNHEYDGPKMEGISITEEDQVPLFYAQAYNLPYTEMPLRTEGGNYMTDGNGAGAQVGYIYQANPQMDDKEIAQQLKQYLGINKTLIVPDISREEIIKNSQPDSEDFNQGLVHIDTSAKYLKPDVILIQEVPETEKEKYEQVQKEYEFFKNTLSSYNTSYKIHRLWAPEDAPYPNSLILNNRVFVPLIDPNDKGDWSNLSDATVNDWNKRAIATYKKAMPGYEVKGYYGPWVKGDGLHCRTKQIPDKHMLYIDHTPLAKQVANKGGYKIDAKIVAHSGQALKQNATKVFWKVNNGSWQSIPMQELGGNQFSAMIPTQKDGSTISYYIRSEDESGRAENHPYIGASWSHSFKVGDKNSPSMDELEAAREAGRQECINDPQSCGIETGSLAYSATLTSTYDLHIPQVIYQSSTGPVSFWADMQMITFEDGMVFEVVDYGVNDNFEQENTENE